MVLLRFLDNMFVLTEENESMVKLLMTKYPPETKVTIWDDKQIIDTLQINEIFDL